MKGLNPCEPCKKHCDSDGVPFKYCRCDCHIPTYYVTKGEILY